MKTTQLISLILLTVVYSTSESATFCATTSSELQAALTSAESNSQDDLIKIAQGSYLTPGAQFDYDESGGWDLEISGGWAEFQGNSCGVQFTGNPFFTTLDADSMNRVLSIKTSHNAKIKISGLSFINGLAGLAFNGGGLKIDSSENRNMGSVTIEKTAFINNTADVNSALSIGRGNKMIVRNSLFFDNHALVGSTVFLITQDDTLGVYFTNNTVTANTTDSSVNEAGVRILIGQNASALTANNLLWNNDNRDIFLTGPGSHHLQNNDIGVLFGVAPVVDDNNFSLPPRFDPGSLNFTPSAISPLVNKGTHPCIICPIPLPFEHNWSLGLTDLEGNGSPRVENDRVDIGAFESPYEPDLIFMNGLE